MSGVTGEMEQQGVMAIEDLLSLGHDLSDHKLVARRVLNASLTLIRAQVLEEAAVAAWGIGMDAHSGVPQDAREIGSQIAAVLRKMKG